MSERIIYSLHTILFPNLILCVAYYIKLEKCSHAHETLLHLRNYTTFKSITDYAVKVKLQDRRFRFWFGFCYWFSGWPQTHSLGFVFNIDLHWEFAGSTFLCLIPSSVSASHISCLLKHDAWNTVCSQLDKDKQLQYLLMFTQPLFTQVKTMCIQACSLQTFLQTLPSFGHIRTTISSSA